ncbi:hypothetical protein JOE21_001441 [Desmospora profundinema]|uniref:Uncharacterized protein n=1 Tax=Desmospora profundinema TaxID=1571184 RepID=A0ABU1IL21_9BACL|nr:hypothetical protein [Desmospora profundinema]
MGEIAALLVAIVAAVRLGLDWWYDYRSKHRGK